MARADADSGKDVGGLKESKVEDSMANCAASALLAAIEIYNKPRVEFREQTLALLLTNAWEILLKARLVQQSGGELESIYVLDTNSGKYKKDKVSGEPLSIGVRRALAVVSVPNEVRANISGIIEIRNRSAHLGVLSAEAQARIHSFGTACVHNFVKLSGKWFGVKLDLPYLLPVGFMGQATVAKETFPKRQSDLLKTLDKLAFSSATSSSEFNIAIQVEVNLNRKLTGGANIGMTNDPSAPLVRLKDDELFEKYPASYNDLTTECGKRYLNFIQNKTFHALLKQIKADPNCAFERKLNPFNEGSTSTYIYNLDAAFAKLDSSYIRRKAK